MNEIHQMLSQHNGQQQPVVLTQTFPQHQKMVFAALVPLQGGKQDNLPRGGNQENPL